MNFAYLKTFRRIKNLCVKKTFQLYCLLVFEKFFLKLSIKYYFCKKFKMKLKLSFFFILFSLFSMAQVGSVTINVFDEFSKKTISATLKIQNINSVYSGNGSISVPELPSGNYNFEITSEGYETGFLNDINVVPNQNLTFSVGLNKSAKQIQEVTLSKKPYKTTPESPVSLRNITAEEIQKNAGSNRDVSKAILSGNIS
jgi:hypothetical protein